MTELFSGGAAVPGGYYLNASRWAIAPVARDGDRLPPGPGRWRRVPVVVALTMVPVLGVTFAMFMPAAGFWVLLTHLAGKVRGLFVRRAPEPPAGGADRPAAGG